jgi:Trk K+ transport system NAD-binding subunit/nucleotide-binding universal stress UspA family protein
VHVIEATSSAAPSAPPSEARPRTIVVGAGRLGRDIARKLAPHRLVHFVERDPAVAAELSATGASVTVGDGTSRLVLDQAGARDAAELVAVTDLDEVNLEAARVGRESLGVRQAVVVLRDVTEGRRIAPPGVDVVEATSPVTSIVLHHIHRGATPATNVGLGAGEIVELTVDATSPIVRRPLRAVRRRDWVLAAIYRGNDLIVPHNHEQLEAGDRLLLVGRPAVLPAIVEFMRAGVARFPHPYGDRVAALAASSGAPSSEPEVAYLAQAIGVEGVDTFGEAPGSGRHAHSHLVGDLETLVHRVHPETPLGRAFAAPGVGCVVVPPEAHGWLEAVGLRLTTIGVALDHSHCPVLVARGSFPYRRIVLAVGRDGDSFPATRAAVGLAKQLGAMLTVAVVSPPEFAGGQATIHQDAELLDEVVDLAEAQGLAPARTTATGNPIREVLRIAGEHDLLVLGHAPRTHRWRLGVRPAVSSYLAHHCPKSTLLVPTSPGPPHVA